MHTASSRIPLIPGLSGEVGGVALAVAGSEYFRRQFIRAGERYYRAVARGRGESYRRNIKTGKGRRGGGGG